MKSEPYSRSIEISDESEDHSSDVDDPSQSENELQVATSGDEYNGGDEGVEILGSASEDTKNVVSRKLINVNKTGANFFLEELTSDDEIFTFQCPKNFNIKSLLNQSIDLGKVTKIEDSGNKYKCQLLENEKKMFTCVFPSREQHAALVNLPVAGHIMITENIKLPKKNLIIEEIAKSEKPKINDTAVRHPLLGRNWREHMKTVQKQNRKQKKMFKKSMGHRKSLAKAEKERKEQKKMLKAQLSLLKKSLSNEVL